LADQQILAVVQPRDRFFHTLTLAISSPFRLLRFAALRKSYISLVLIGLTRSISLIDRP